MASNDPSVVTDRNTSTQSVQPRIRTPDPSDPAIGLFSEEDLVGTLSLWSNAKTTFYQISCRDCATTEFFHLDGPSLRQTQWLFPEYADFLRYDVPYEKPTSSGELQVYKLLAGIKEIHVRNWNAPPDASIHNTGMGRESLMDDIIQLIFQLIGVGQLGLLKIRNQIRINFVYKGRDACAKVDGAVQDETGRFYLLVVTENNDFITPFGQLMAGAVAAFQFNNKIRSKMGKLPLDVMIFPGIAWIYWGSLPHFYRIKITKELADAVMQGYRPVHETIVYRLVPPIDESWMFMGLLRRENRGIVMKILENLKDFLPSPLNDLPVGWTRVVLEDDNMFKMRLRRSAGTVT